MAPNEAAGRRPRALVPLGATTPTEVILGYMNGRTDVAEVRAGTERFRAQDGNVPQLPLGGETAQQTFDRFLRSDLAPALRRLGLKGSGRHYHWDRGQSNLGWVSFQGGKYNSRAMVEFTINLTVARTLSGVQHWWNRIGSFLPVVADTWWRVPAGAATEDLLVDLVDSISDHGLVALEAAMDEVEHPRVPPRSIRRPLPSRDHPFQVYVPASLDAAFEDVSSDDAFVRGGALRVIYQYAPTDPSLVPILTSMLNDEGPFERATAATMLGFVPCEPDVSLFDLHRALDEDEHRNVRIAARHAIRTVEHRYGLT
jgi:hypothetical protein